MKFNKVEVVYKEKEEYFSIGVKYNREDGKTFGQVVKLDHVPTLQEFVDTVNIELRNVVGVVDDGKE
jgi:hypothetical protein